MRVLLISLVLQIFISCNKYENPYPLSNNELLSEIRSEFKNDSLSFYQSFDKTTYNFRQSLTRVIHWNKSKQKNDTVVIPITLKLPEGQINSETGKNTLNHRVFLKVYKENNGDYRFNILTFIGEGASFNKFSGVVYTEDYFKGDVRYNTYYQGTPSKTKEINHKIQTKLASVKDNKIARSLDCNWTKIGRICVGHPTDDSAPDICSDRHEYQCNWTDEPIIIDEEQWEEDPGGGGGGGDSPTPEPEINDTIPLNINFTCGGDNTEFKNSFYNALKNIESGIIGNQDYGCFSKNILKAIQNKPGVLVLNVCLKSKDFGPNGTYDPKTKTMGFINESVHDMTTLHELIHYYQDFSGHYPNMSAMAGGNKGFSNLEFETRLLLDIMKGYGDEYINELINGKLLTAQEVRTIRNDYEIFIKSFRDADNNLINPNTINKSNFNTQYQSFLTLYSTKSKNYQSEIDSNLEPKVLDELLKFIFNNCN